MTIKGTIKFYGKFTEVSFYDIGAQRPCTDKKGEEIIKTEFNNNDTFTVTSSDTNGFAVVRIRGKNAHGESLEENGRFTRDIRIVGFPRGSAKSTLNAFGNTDFTEFVKQVAAEVGKLK